MQGDVVNELCRGVNELVESETTSSVPTEQNAPSEHTDRIQRLRGDAG